MLKFTIIVPQTLPNKNYTTGIHLTVFEFFLKITNCSNKVRVLKKMGFQLSKNDIDHVINCTPDGKNI